MSDFHTDVSRWGFFYDPPAGSVINQAVALVLEAAKKDRRVYGLVFNGTVLWIDREEDTVETLVAKYHARREAT